MSDVLIRPATGDDVSAFYAKLPFQPVDAEVVVCNGEPIAMGGVVREPNAVGTLFEEDAPLVAFLDVRKQGDQVYGVKAILAMRRGLKRHGVPVTVQCDESYESAERLLQLLGFKRTNLQRSDARNGTRMLKVWKWQP